MVYEEESGDIQIALTGDTLAARRLAAHREPRYLAVRDLLRSADVSLTNAETLFHEYESAPISDPGPYGTYAHATRTSSTTCGGSASIWSRQLTTTPSTSARLAPDQYPQPECAWHAVCGTGRNLSEAVAPAYLRCAEGQRGVDWRHVDDAAGRIIARATHAA